MFSSKNIVVALYLALSMAGANANAQELFHGGVVPLNKIPSEQWIEKVMGDMGKPGQPFVIRIPHDAGYGFFSAHPSRRREHHGLNRQLGSRYGSSH